MLDPTDIPPLSRTALAHWFGEAVRAELAELEKKGGERRIELHAGSQIGAERSPFTIYRFALADNTLVPEDSSGTIEFAGQTFKASVVAIASGRIDIQIDGSEALTRFIDRAMLRFDDLTLLRKLADVLESLESDAESVSSLAVAMFHPKSIGVKKCSLPQSPALDAVMGEQRVVLEQACASEITFVWGPPGTGKTYVIAHLIAALVEQGERVLMTSHTHAAVDQAIYETVRPAHESASGKPGPLEDSDLERDGAIVRIGRVTNPKVPESVRLDNIVDRKATGIQSEITEVQRQTEPLKRERANLLAQLADHERLNELRQRLADAKRDADLANLSVVRESREDAAARGKVEACQVRLAIANHAWFFRAGRIERARLAFDDAKRSLSAISQKLKEANAAKEQFERAVESHRREIETDDFAWLPPAAGLRTQLSAVDARLDRLEEGLNEFQARLDALENEIITNARVVAATLTKCYVGKQLDGQSFDALIVDEISMALPPLLFVAGRRITRRVILVGDFKQLPPIVRSDHELADKRLRRDIFHLARIASDLQQTGHPAMTSLRMQRRMLAPIADAARHISYDSQLVDHPDVLRRRQPDWLSFLSENALLIVDTADLHCWSRRQPGSLSRFNLYSAHISAEIAAMAAAAIPRPESTVAPPIGIVTPYAAQRRLIKRLVDALDLEAWVQVGTVHTFQGGEADLIIFDSVLDEPFFTSRLSNPNVASEVKRDLNVALTRAKSKFVLVGSSDWLNRRTKPTSGLGQLWDYMKQHADLVSAHTLVEIGFADRVAQSTEGYRVPRLENDASVHEILDESTFFERFEADLRTASKDIFGLVPYFGNYRWPRMEPLFRAALERGVEVTFVTPPPDESSNKSYVEAATRNLRALGAVVVASTGLHGKDVIIDSRILYTGSLNWASHRGRSETMHRVEDPKVAQAALEHLQARHIRTASLQGGLPRTCPQCHGPTQVVNQARSMGRWDKQPMKLGCASYKNTKCKYLRDIDERAPFLEPPRCRVDGRTEYRRVKSGRGERWKCPKHPKECETFPVIPDDV